MNSTEECQTVDLRPLRAMLAENGLIRENGDLDFAAHEPAFPRLPRDRRWHFRVSSHGEALFHLIVGTQLGPLHSRAADFFQACPQLACRPLCYGAHDDGLEYLCLEHFAGESLDQAVQAGKCTVTQWLAAVRKAQRILARTAQPSTPAGLKREVQQLCASACALPGFSEADAALLRDLAQPLLIAGCSSDEPSLRWSNGDFVGRNLLINDRGEIRLIDYEFAARTHFGRADWLRLFQFSVPPRSLEPSSVRELERAQKPWQQVYLWLHQLSHQQGAAPSQQQEQHVATAVSQLFKAFRNAATVRLPGRKQSFLIDSLSRQQSQIELQLEQRTAWATSLDAALTKARAAHAEQARLVGERTAWAKALDTDLEKARVALAAQTKQVEERTAWAKVLDADLHRARTTLVEQAKLVEERSVWGKSLGQELRSAQVNFAKLTKEHDKRTAWARKLETDLKQSRDALAAQTKVAAERTVWAQQLDIDLGKARAAHAEQVRLVAERTGWAKELDAELQNARALFAEQSKLVEERTAWAQSLDAELKQARATPVNQVKRLHELDAELNGTREKLAEQAKLAQERSAHAEALDAELQSTQRNFAKLSKEHAERTAWALALDAELQEARCRLTEQSKLVEERTAWAKALHTEVQKAREVAAEREQLAQQTLGALAVLRRDLVAKNVEAKATVGSLLDAELRAEAAEAEVRRLTATQSDALNQMHQLLRQAQFLQQTITGLDAVRQATEEKLRQLTRELARYQTRLLCRLAARRPSSPALRLHP